MYPRFVREGVGRWDNGTKIDYRSGQEGPSHDPYHYDEVSVSRRGVKTVLHVGLVVWMEVYWVDHSEETWPIQTMHLSVGSHGIQEENEILDFFKVLMGASFGWFIGWYYAIQARKPQEPEMYGQA